MDICKHQLGLNVFSKRNTRGLRIFNVAVRDSSPKYVEYPGIVAVASDKEKFEQQYGVKLEANKRTEIEDDLTTEEREGEKEPAF